MDLFRKKRCQRSQSVPGSAADAEKRGVRVDRLVVGADPCLIKIKIRQHIIFVKDKTISVCEHEGIFFYFVVSLRDTQESNAERFADAEFGRTYQIADVFHKNNIQVIQRKFGKDMPDAHGLDMAGSVRIQLNSGNAEAGNSLGVHLSCDVPLNDTDTEIVSQPFDQSRNQAGFPGAGASHNVNHTDVTGSQGIFYFFADILIPLHDLMQYFYFHGYSPPVQFCLCSLLHQSPDSLCKTLFRTGA